MSQPVKIPSVGESVSEVEIGPWRKGVGDAVEKDEELVSLETDKASVELPSPARGVLVEIRHAEGDTVKVGSVIAMIDEAAQAGAASAQGPAEEGEAEQGEEPAPGAGRAPTETEEEAEPATAERAAEPEPQAEEPAGEEPQPDAEEPRPEEPQAAESEAEDVDEQPAAGAAEERTAELIPRSRPVNPAGTKPGKTEARPATAPPPKPRPAAQAAAKPQRAPKAADEPEVATGGASEADVDLVPLSRLRRTIARRLVEAQHAAALLTTFNEIDLSAVQELRTQHGPAFEERYGVRLGLMSFFVKAAIAALQEVPELNAELRGEEIAYHRRHHIGIAVGSGAGLVVPVLRDAGRMSLAVIETAIADLAERAQRGALELHELQGGTFTLTNGGVYGSLLSTPIVNPPQSGILGMHAIQDRPVARAGEVVIRPMMYVALTYDHRLIDGREAVTFLRRVKELVETPARLLLEA